LASFTFLFFKKDQLFVLKAARTAWTKKMGPDTAPNIEQLLQTVSSGAGERNQLGPI